MHRRIKVTGDSQRYFVSDSINLGLQYADERSSRCRPRLGKRDRVRVIPSAL